jgi:hypothetical protein
LEQLTAIVENAEPWFRAFFLVQIHILGRYDDVAGLMLFRVDSPTLARFIGPDPCHILTFIQVAGKRVLNNIAKHGILRNVNPVMDVHGALGALYILIFTIQGGVLNFEDPDLFAKVSLFPGAPGYAGFRGAMDRALFGMSMH